MSDVAGVIFSVSEEDTCTGVDAVFRRLVRWREPVTTADGTRVAIPREGRSIEDQTIDLLEPREQKIQGVRADTAVYGEQTLTYDVPGMLWLTTDDGDTLTAVDLTQYIRDAGDVIIDRRGWGGIFGEIEVLDTVAGLPGDYLDLTVPHQVNARTDQTPKAQRGGTRKVQIIGRTPHAGTATLQLEDAGNLAQTLPTQEEPPAADAVPVPEFTLAASADDPLTVAVATVTNDTSLEDFGAVVEWEYSVGDTEPVTSGTAFGPLALGFGIDEIDVPAVPSGSTVWVRARGDIVLTGERSDFSAWQSLQLGPSENGETGSPTLTLSYTIDSDGVVDVLATTTGTSVKFALADAGDLEATDAAVRAATADTSAPFQALAIVTLGEGDNRVVSAYAYDVLLNESIKVSITVTRAVDSGAGAGTPGNQLLTWHATPAVIVRAVGSALYEPEAAIPSRRYLNTSNVGAWRDQLANWYAAPGVEFHRIYSLDGGTSWADAGPMVALDDVGFPLPGDFAALTALAVGNNVLFSWGLSGGDGSTSVAKVGNIHSESTSSDSPPASPDPETPTDVPSGGPLGPLLGYWNARSADYDGFTDGQSAPTFFDDSTSDNDGAPVGGGVQAAGTYETNALGTGLPAIRCDGATEGYTVDAPSQSVQTWYFVIGNVTGAGTQGTNGATTNASIAATNGGAGSRFSFGVRANGHLTVAWNNSAGNPNQREGTAAISGAGPHLLRFVWDQALADFYAYVDGVLDIGPENMAENGNMVTVSAVGFANYNGISNVITVDYGCVLCFGGAHVGAVGAPVETALQTIWGTP